MWQHLCSSDLRTNPCDFLLLGIVSSSVVWPGGPSKLSLGVIVGRACSLKKLKDVDSQRLWEAWERVKCGGTWLQWEPEVEHAGLIVPTPIRHKTNSWNSSFQDVEQCVPSNAVDLTSSWEVDFLAVPYQPPVFRCSIYIWWRETSAIADHEDRAF